VWQLFIFVLVWLSLTILFAGVLSLGTLWLQGYVYTEATTGLLWRGPAAGAALGLFVALWCLLNYLAPGEYDTLWTFSSRQKTEFEQLQVVKGKETKTYHKRKDPQGHVAYVDSLGQPPPENAEEIIVSEDGKEVHFKPERWTKGPDKDKLRRDQGQSLKYVDERGRVMSQDALGRIDVFRWGRWMLNLWLNFFHLLLWFVCLWLLLRFQWAHALGLAVILWLVMTIPVLPILLSKAADAGHERLKQRAGTAAPCDIAMVVGSDALRLARSA
jgi:hypothetical protein